jgi:ribosomal protein S27AE
VTSPLRVLRQIVAPNGRHRPRRAVLLPDEPFPAPSEPVRRGVLTETELAQLLDAEVIVANESADCPACARSTFHAMHRDGSRRCWTCGTTVVPGGAGRG